MPQSHVSRWYVLLLPLFLVRLLDAQSVQLSLSVPPPYPIYLEDYLEFRARTIVTVTNMTAQTHQVKLLARVESTDGRISARIKTSFLPATPVILGPNETRVFQGEQLRSIHVNLTLNDIDHQGLDPRQIARTGTLPEGAYQLCITAYQYQTGQALSSPMAGCAMLHLTHYDPPIILQPQHQSAVEATKPQFLNFVWTPAGLAGKTLYNLRLVDMTATGLFNPNDAFTGKVIPFFDRSGLLTPSYAYSIADLPLQEGHQYAVEVVAYDPTQGIAFRNNGRSAVTTFTWKAREGIRPGPDELSVRPGGGDQGGAGKVDPPGFGLKDKDNPLPDPPNGDCISDPAFKGTIGQQVRQTITNGVDFTAGLFTVKNTVFTKNGGGTFNGTGTVKVPFLNLTVEVEFTGIQLDTDNRLKAGKLTAKVISPNIINDQMARVRDGVIENLPNAQGLYDQLQQAQNFVSNLNPDLPRVLPVSWDNATYRLGVVGLIFEPTKAYLNTVLPIDVPQAINGEWLTLAAKGIAMHPGGFGEASVQVGLAKDVSLPLSQNVSMRIQGGAQGTKAFLDCNGFHALNIVGALELSRQIALPLDAQHQVIQDPNVKVSAPFAIDAAVHFEDILIQGAGLSHPFAVPEARDFVFTTQEVTLDFSTARNSNAFNGAYPGKTNDWIGLYLQQLTLTLPEGFRKEGGGRITVSLQDLMVDKMGVHVHASVKGAPLADGSIAGWGFSLNQVDLLIAASKLSGGGLGGTIQVPLGEKAKFGFDAMVSKGDDQGAKYHFTVETGSDLDADLFLAKIKLHEGSKINLTRQDGKFEVATVFHGELSIGFTKKPENSNMGKLNIPSLQFQELVINGKDQPGFVPEIQVAFAALNNMKNIQARIGDAFELGLTKLEFKTDKQGGSRAGLSIGAAVSLFGGDQDEPNAIGASTALTFWAKYDPVKKTYRFDQAKLDALSIGAEIGVAYVKGNIEIFDQDDTYGNGFRGGLLAELRGLNAGIDVNIQFGHTLPNKGNFKYWYFDAMFELPDPGINIPMTPASFYGFGGGAWCNMTRTGGIGNAALKPGAYIAQAKGGGAPTTSGASFTPALGKGGFKASVILGMTGSKEAFNADLIFSMAFDVKTLGVEDIRLTGIGYGMQGLDVVPRSQEGAKITCVAELGVHIPSRTFSGAFVVSADAAGMDASGGASILFQLPPKDAQGNVIPTENLKWHIKLGWWTPGFAPFDDPTRLSGILMGFSMMALEYNVKFQGYLMAGNDLPAGLPPMPAYILDLCSHLGAEPKKGLPPQAQSAQNLAFALGAGLQFNAGFDFKVLYADLQAEAVFDVLIANLNATCDGKQVGINGWYAQGQAYAYVYGDAGLFLIPLVELAAGALLEVKLPNPNYIRGSFAAYVKALGKQAGKYEGVFEAGQPCNIQTDMDPFQGVTLITGVSPAHNEKEIDPFDPEISVSFKYRIGEPIMVYNPYLGYDEWYTMDAGIRLTDKQGKEIPLKNANFFWKQTVNIEPKAMLDPKKEYRIVVDARIVKGKEVKKSESLNSRFDTGDFPAKFTVKDLVASYPFPSQRYAMREAMNGGPATGMLQMKLNLCYLINPQGYKTVAEFAELHSGKVFSSDCDCVGGSQAIVRFDMPAGLQPETIYELRIINRQEDKPKDPQQGLQFKANVQTVVFEGLHFRTSKYRSLKDKLASYQVVRTGYVTAGASYSYNVYGQDQSNATNYHIPIVMVSGGEHFDRYEMELYTIQDGQGANYTGGKLVSESAAHIPWQNAQAGTFVQFSSLPKTSRDLLLGYGANKNITRPSGFPFYGTVNKPMKSDNVRLFTALAHIGTYESLLRGGGYLSGSESLIGPDDVLSPGEILAAKSGNKFQGGQGLQVKNMNQGAGQGGGFQGAPLQFQGGQQGPGGSGKLFAFMDARPLFYIQDKWLYDRLILNAAVADGKIATAFQAIKGLGWPQYPTGARQMQFNLKEYRRINGWHFVNHGPVAYTTVK